MRRAAVALALCWASLSACGPDRPQHSGDPTLDARIRVSPTPAVQRANQITLEVTSEGTPLEAAVVRVRGEAGASETTLSLPEQVAPPADVAGTYGPISVDFPAVGSWWIIVAVEAPDGRTAEVRHPLSVVGGAG